MEGCEEDGIARAGHVPEACTLSLQNVHADNLTG